MVAIYKYGFESAIKRFEDEGVLLKTLTNYDFLIRVAEQQNYINTDEIAVLQQWRQNPTEWK